MDYDHREPSAFTRDDCERAVGKAASLPLTGEIVAAGQSASGPYVRFHVDERFGFGDHFIVVVDLDALEVKA